MTEVVFLDISTSESGESKDGSENINDGCISIRRAGSRALVLCTLTRWHHWMGYWMEKEPLLTALVTHVLFLLRQVKHGLVRDELRRTKSRHQVGRFFQQPWQKRSLPIRSDFPTYTGFPRGLQSPLIMTGRPIKMLHRRSVISVGGPASVLHIQYFHVNQHRVGSLLCINHPSRPVALKHKHVWNIKSRRRRKEIKTHSSSVSYLVSHGCTAARMSFWESSHSTCRKFMCRFILQ